MGGGIYLALAFTLGWAACCIFMWAGELFIALCERRRNRLYLEEIAIWEPRCAWPESGDARPKFSAGGGAGKAERPGYAQMASAHSHGEASGR